MRTVITEKALPASLEVQICAKILSNITYAGHALMHILFLPGLDVRATSTPAQI